MVSKIAVMALVAVVAVPILLGYGLNINTENKQVWTENNDPLDAKDYLMTTFDATGATYTNADIYQMNSRSFYRYYETIDGHAVPVKFYPNYPYGALSQTKSSLQLGKLTLNTSFWLGSDNGYSHVFVNGMYDGSNYYTARLSNNGAPLYTVAHIKQLIFDGTTVYTQTYDSSNYVHQNKYTDVTRVDMDVTGSVTANAELHTDDAPYVNLSKGYRLNEDGAVWRTSDVYRPSDVQRTSIEISRSTKSILISLDLNTVTDSDSQFWIISNNGAVVFKKTTTDGVPKWEFTPTVETGSWIPRDYQDIYYNPLASSNTYQLYLNADNTGELRYIGGWPDAIGAATPMLITPFEVYDTGPLNEHLTLMRFEGRSPLMRIDAAMVGAYDYRVMEDAVYDPAAFRANPITTLTNGLRFGPSLEFGGNTYQVTKGNITIGTHDFSLEGMTFESILVGGQYENRIDGNTVSTTATPSTITFNGKWLTDVTTESQSMETVSDTKWEPGKFAWDGIDTDFKIAGLMASLGAFIALAVYGRRSGTKVMPLLVVCGGAALMFLVMI